MLQKCSNSVHMIRIIPDEEKKKDHPNIHVNPVQNSATALPLSQLLNADIII